MNIAYVRVSTEAQNTERQLESLKKYNIDKWYTEKISAKNTDRPQLQEMMDFVREGDTIYIHDFSRLARSTKDLLSILEFLEKKKVKVISEKENFDTSTATGRLMLQIISSINEFERNNILERQREGIRIAKEAGKYKGRKKTVIEETKWNEALNLYNTRKINKIQMAKRLKISRPTLDKLLKAQ